MKCPKCQNELRRSQKDPSFGLCDNCRLKFKWIDDREEDYEDGNMGDYRPNYQAPARNEQRMNREQTAQKSKSAPFKTWKLVSGILSIILFVIVSLQSCAAGVANTLEENGEVGGSAGVIVSIMLLTGGIVSIATRNSTKRGGNIALIILFGIGALFGFLMAGSFGDLYIWAAWCLINVIFAIISIIKSK